MVRAMFRPVRATSPGLALAVGLLAPAAATGLEVLIDPTEPAGAVSLYMLAVVAAAAIGGLWSGLTAALLSFLGLNFFFTRPRHTFRVTKVEDVVALLVFLVVASIVGLLLARALDERSKARRREQEAWLLSSIATTLLSGAPLERVLQDCAEALLGPFGLVRCGIQASVGNGSIHVEAGRPDVPGGPVTEIPLQVGIEVVGALSVTGSVGGAEPDPADRHLLESCAKQVGVALERARLDVQVRDAQVESEASELRAALFSSVTHDLRTPLASIKAGVTSLLDAEAKLGPERERELLRTILEETDRLNRLVGNLLELARMRSGALVPTKQLVALDEILGGVLSRMRGTIAGITVRTVIRPDLPDVDADPVQIDQVLTNILENAARFSPPGGEVLISLATWQRSVQVRVADHGPGIPPEERERVFDAFYRRDAGAGRGGTGLGLAIARAVVLAHGGKIWAEGAPGGGTAIVLELPIAAGTRLPIGKDLST